MSKTIQIKNMPEATHHVLKARAAHEGMSLSDFLKRELEHIAERPSMREWLDRVRRLKPVRTSQSAAEAVRDLRGREQ